MNAWDNILATQLVYDLMHQENQSSSISDYDLSYIICVRDSKPRIRNYKNFLIYLTNHYYLTDTMDETNLTFKKLFRKIEILLQNKDNTEKEIAKSIRKDTKDIFEIIRLSRKPKISFIDIVLIIIGIAYRIEVFKNIRDIEIAY